MAQMEDGAAAVMAQPLVDAVAAGKRERSKAANREAIIEAARRIFAQLGYEATTVRDIIRGTDLASGTFYNYFKSKEEVFEALQDDGARRFRPLLRAEGERAATFESFVKSALASYFQFVAEENNALGGAERLGHAVHTDTPHMRAVFHELKSYTEEIIARGLAPPMDTDYFVAAAIGMAREVGLRMLRRNPPDVEAAAAFCAAMILGGAPSLPPAKR
jgi:AcrR family transcriptional regulator